MNNTLHHLGILTFHYSLNEGAQLQAWALQRFIADALNVPTNIIDYRPAARIRHHQQYWDVPHKDSLSEPFASEHLDIRHADAQRVSQQVNAHYAGVILGSDEIWRFNPFNIPTSNTLHAPSLYFGAGISVPSVAYGVSIGNARAWTLNPLTKKYIARAIDRLQFIGVRDEQTAAFVRSLSMDFDARVYHVPDPTFAAPLPLIDRDAMRTRWYDAGVDTDKPVVMLVPNKRHSIDPASLQELELNQYKIVSLYDNYDVCSLESLRLNPLEWFSAIAAADIVISQRMHGLIAALIGNVPCIPIRRLRKIQSLCSDFSLLGGTAEQVRLSWSHEHVEQRKAEYRQLHQTAVGHLRSTFAGAFG